MKIFCLCFYDLIKIYLNNLFLIQVLLQFLVLKSFLLFIHNYFNVSLITLPRILWIVTVWTFNVSHRASSCCIPSFNIASCKCKMFTAIITIFFHFLKLYIPNGSNASLTVSLPRISIACCASSLVLKIILLEQ